MSSSEDSKQISAIKQLINTNDKLARQINDLLWQKEELENQIYIETTKNKLTEALDVDIDNIQDRIAQIKQEDRDVMEQLNLSDKALEKKDRTVIELD